jgi:hypothetical protein
MMNLEKILILYSGKYSAFGKSLCTYKRLFEVMSTSTYTGLNHELNKHFVGIALQPLFNPLPALT